MINRFCKRCRGTRVGPSPFHRVFTRSPNDVIFILVVMKYNVMKLCTCSEMICLRIFPVPFKKLLPCSNLTSEDPCLQSQNQAGDLRHPLMLPEVPGVSFPGVKKVAATLEETAPKRPKAAPPEAAKASKASSDESSDESGKDVKDGQEDAAVEVKDAETLWKVNIEAVYRRKNP